MQNNSVHANPIMKTDIMFHRVLTALAFAAALALPPAPARAQTNDPAKAQTNSPVQFDLEIQNGKLLMPGPDHSHGNADANLGNIVELLREKHPEANIVMVQKVAGNRVDFLKMHAGRLTDELEALRVASGGCFDLRVFDPSSAKKLYILEPSEKMLRAQAEEEESARRPPEVEVFNFSAYFNQHRDSGMDDGHFQILQNETIDKTKDIIRQTLASFEPQDKMNFQFHPGANLLVVTGTQAEINIARKIINAMIEKTSGDLSPFKALEDARKKRAVSSGTATP